MHTILDIYHISSTIHSEIYFYNNIKLKTKTCNRFPNHHKIKCPYKPTVRENMNWHSLHSRLYSREAHIHKYNRQIVIRRTDEKGSPRQRVLLPAWIPSFPSVPTSAFSAKCSFPPFELNCRLSRWNRLRCWNRLGRRSRLSRWRRLLLRNSVPCLGVSVRDLPLRRGELFAEVLPGGLEGSYLLLRRLELPLKLLPVLRQLVDPRVQGLQEGEASREDLESSHRGRKKTEDKHHTD